MLQKYQENGMEIDKRQAPGLQLLTLDVGEAARLLTLLRSPPRLSSPLPFPLPTIQYFFF